MKLRNTLREFTRYPTALAGVVIILLLIGVSIYTMIALPYKEAVLLWRGGVGVWDENPKLVPPAWINYFNKIRVPETIVLNSADGTATKTVISSSGDIGETDILFTFDYPYEGFPQDVLIYFTATYAIKQPHAALTWITPDGREILAGSFSVAPTQTFYASQDERLQRKLNTDLPQEGLFLDPNAPADAPVAVEGTYKLLVQVFTFESDASVDAKMVIVGKVYGLAGTDHQRRDLMIALLWGTPLALAFGLLAALGTTFTTMVISALGAWFGGWVDGIIQRITEVNMVLPFLSILIMVGTFYSRSLWLMLGVTILLSIFGGTIKTYRAIFLQVKESPYIEAARAYGASNGRIIVQYLVPRIVPLLIPALVTLIPTYVFLEASLAVLGLGDPVMPTWGKIINDAQQNGALYQGLYYWILEPAILLMITGLAFSMVGFAMDRIFNPRLRSL